MSTKYLPSCWRNDERMESLFMEFRTRDINPSGWDDKMHFWQSAIINWSNVTKNTIFNFSNLNTAFKRNNDVPACLDVVLNQMLKNGKLTTIEYLPYSNPNASWLSWGYSSFVKTPLTWGMDYFKSSLHMDSINTKEFINLPLIEKLAQEVISNYRREFKDNWMIRLLDFSQFFEMSKELCPHRQSFDLVLGYLESKRHLQIYNHENSKIIKLADDNGKLSPTLNEVDLSILRLKKGIVCLEVEITEMENLLEKYKVEAVQVLKSNKKAQALRLVKKKRNVEAAIKKKIASLDNLHAMEMQLQNTLPDQQILEALKLGSSALKGVFSSGLSLEKCDATMMDVEEAFEQQEEIAATMSKPVGFSLPSDSALENELDELLASDEPEQSKSHDIDMDMLPEVPITFPGQLSPTKRPTNTFKAPTIFS